MSYNIGIFHALGDFNDARQTSINHCKYLENYQPQNRYLYHDIRSPVTPALRRIRFDVIIFDVTFLCYRWAHPRSAFDEIRSRYAFLAEQDAVRAAFPQDEYDHGEVLDEWLDEYRVDLVWSVVWDAWDLIFPRTQKRARIHRGLTGYVDDGDVGQMDRYLRPWSERRVDVGYRARDLPPRFGRYGQQKARIGERFAAAAQGRGLNLDISNRPEDVFLGDGWLRFLCDSKYTIGCEGGSSIWDPRGKVQDRVQEYVAEHPEADYEEVEHAVLQGENRDPPFSAISPRLFEVTAARSAQIMIRAPYLGVLEPDTHYLCLEPDLSNVQAVLDAMSDPDHAARMIEACYETLIVPETYRYSAHAAAVLEAIGEVADEKNLEPARDPHFEALRAEHEQAVIQSMPTPVPRRLRDVIPAPLRSIIRPHWRRARRWLSQR